MGNSKEGRPGGRGRVHRRNVRESGKPVIIDFNNIGMNLAEAVKKREAFIQNGTEAIGDPAQTRAERLRTLNS